MIPLRSSVRPSVAIVVVTLVIAVCLALSHGGDSVLAHAAGSDDVRGPVTRLDAASVAAWRQAGVDDVGEADGLLLARRLSLALTGSIPSLEEIRALERLPDAERLDAHLEALLRDRRSADYLAERLARSFVGTEQGPAIIFRRRRFVYWLSDSIYEDESYAELVRAMVDGRGLWTDRPAVNFLTAHELDPVRLTARTTRAFLGMRLDCAQCHDHPFADWKQKDFAGLAAHYAGLQKGVTGVTQETADFEPAGRMMMAPQDTAKVSPAVPFAKQAHPDGPPRRSLAAWLTSEDNHAFGKAIANRMWTLLLGRSLTRTGPDDIEGAERMPGAMTILADDFVQHGHRLKRLIRVIAHSRAFSRRAAAATTAKPATAAKSTSKGNDPSDVFAAFPRVKLRPEQVAGALVQLSSLHTLDADTHILGRVASAANTNDFVRRYGSLGDDELLEQGGTVTQNLVMMNGRIVRERIAANLLSASGRIAMLTPKNAQRVEVAFLTAYTRAPTAGERAVFEGALEGKRDKELQRAMEDVMWALVNATEFSWSR